MNNNETRLIEWKAGETPDGSIIRRGFRCSAEIRNVVIGEFWRSPEGSTAFYRPNMDRNKMRDVFHAWYETRTKLED